MRYVLMFFYTSLLFACCQHQAKLGHIPKMGEARGIADENTFFPLIAGSSWYYADYIAGERAPKSVTRDSVALSEKTDTGHFVTVYRYSEVSKSTDTIFYSVNAKGVVYKYLSRSDEPDMFALLNPEIGSKIGKMTYIGFCSKSPADSGICMRLEEYPYDSAKTQVAKMKWQFFYFKKGIGIVANGGDELVTRLEKYKIGTGPLKKY